MKKLLAGLIVGFMIGATGTALAANDVVQAKFSKYFLKINDRESVEIEPLVYKGTTYLPVREAAELLGYDVDYEDAARTIILKNATTEGDTKNEDKGDDDMPSAPVIHQHSIKEEFTIGNTTITLNSVTYSDFVPYTPGDSAGFTASNGETFAVINFSVLIDADTPKDRAHWPPVLLISGVEAGDKRFSGSFYTTSKIYPRTQTSVEVFVAIPENLQVDAIEFVDPSGGSADKARVTTQ